VAARDAGALVAIARDPADGSLAYLERHDGSTPFTSGLTGAADVQVSPDGRWVYVCSAVDNALAVFARDRSSGELHVQQVLTDADAGVDGLDGCRELALTADGMHLYAAAADESAIGHFTFVRSTRIFANGFESASTAQWSSTAP
jgi:6-phosphogluconolactonase (cycloisomerase 2 family)